jgi:hypothetical protein
MCVWGDWLSGSFSSQVFSFANCATGLSVEDLIGALDDDAPEHVALLGDAYRRARADSSSRPRRRTI